MSPLSVSTYLLILVSALGANQILPVKVIFTMFNLDYAVVLTVQVLVYTFVKEPNCNKSCNFFLVLLEVLYCLLV